MCRSLLDIGFTTISSVWNTPSTTMPKSLAADLRDDDEAAVDRRRPVLEAEQLAQAHERQQLVAQPQHRRVLDALDAVLAAAARAHELDDRRAAEWRSDRRRPPRSEPQTIASVSGILMVKLSAGARHRLHVDGAADLVDIVAHDVHADAAAGNVGDLARRWRSQARR